MTVTRHTVYLALAASIGACGKADSANGSPTQRDTPVIPLVGSTPAPDTGADMAIAATGNAVAFYPDTLLRRTGHQISTGQSTARVFLNRPGVQFVEARRVHNGTPEVHDEWADVTVVQSGRATLLSGGRVSGSALRSPGEHRGGVLSGGSSRVVTAGDLFYVPPRIPHQYLIATGDSIRYLTVKVPRVR